MPLAVTLPPTFIGHNKLVYRVGGNVAGGAMADAITNANLIDVTNGIGSFPRSRLYQLLAAGYADQAAARAALLEVSARIVVEDLTEGAIVDGEVSGVAVDVALTGGAGTAPKVQMQIPVTNAHTWNVIIEAFEPSKQ